MMRRSVIRVLSAGLWATAFVGVVSTIGAGCGEPQDPEIPTAPDAAMFDGGGEASPTECFGAKDGTACEGGKKVCVNSICVVASCGDGLVTPPEECDHGQLNGPGTGCEGTCRFTCVANDATRGCPSNDPCIEDGKCDGAAHTCIAGNAKPSGTTCGTGKTCKGKECVAGVCGDAVTTSPEDCDNGAANAPGSGCEKDCTFSCKNAATDCAAVPCTIASCSAAHTCQTAPDASKNGQTCGSGLVCNNGACIAPGASCGNGVVEGGEDCDFGGGNGAGTGCESNCKFSCTKSPSSCTDTNACHDAPACTTVTVNGKTGQKCMTGATKADGATCGIGSICMAGTCAPSVCGDSYRDATLDEQCDDGNVTSLDGCDGACKFEQDHRVTALKMQFGTDAYCSVNALGKAIGFLAQSSFQKSIDDDVKSGVVSEMLAFAPGVDLTGASGAVTVGSLSGDPTSTVAPYSGTADLDWWYTPNASHIDGNRRARASLTGTFASGTLDATGSMNMIVSVGGGLANLAVTSAKLHMTVAAVTTPLSSAGATPPGHTAAEHLSPAIKSFSTGGNTAAAPAAQMCGNISATSLNNTPVPLSLLPGGDNACNEKYTTDNRLIDVLVHGCHVGPLNVTAIKATQPDQVDPAAPAAGAGGPYKLAVDAAKRVVSCTDSTNASVTLSTCLDAAAYSCSFKYATDRVIIR